MGRGRGVTRQLCCAHSSRGFPGLTPGSMLHYLYFDPAYLLRFPGVFRFVFAEVGSGARWMNFPGARSNKFLLVILAIAVAILGALTTQVMHQQHDQSPVDQVPLRAAPTLPAGRVPAGADIMASPNGATHPDAATTPNPANAMVGPASQPAPASPAPQVAPGPQVATTGITPALVAPMPRIVTPTTRSHRRVHAVPAPPPTAAAPPVTSAPQTASPVKPGSPDGW
jgi:hypothetical protein